MNTLELFKQSNAWDARYTLPTVPQFNNPWIYIAYVCLIVKMNGERTTWLSLQDPLKSFFKSCNIERGLINRWPDGGGGTTSHDEIMGAAYLIPGFAADALRCLKWNAGFYDNQEEDQGIFKTQYRFIFLVPFLKACTYRDEKPIKPSVFDQFLFALHLTIQSFTKTPDYGDLLMSWLMIDMMEAFYICRLAIAFWEWRLTKKGITSPQTLFSQYLTEAPVFQKTAPARF